MLWKQRPYGSSGSTYPLSDLGDVFDTFVVWRHGGSTKHRTVLDPSRMVSEPLVLRSSTTTRTEQMPVSAHRSVSASSVPCFS